MAQGGRVLPLHTSVGGKDPVRIRGLGDAISAEGLFYSEVHLTRRKSAVIFLMKEN